LKKDLKTFLNKMMIICECLGESLPLHHFHRATIRETVLFIQSSFIETKRFQKRRMALTDDGYTRVVEQGTNQCSGLLPGLRTCGTTKRQEL
jgi:hypothetical protein